MAVQPSAEAMRRPKPHQFSVLWMCRAGLKPKAALATNASVLTQICRMQRSSGFAVSGSLCNLQRKQPQYTALGFRAWELKQRHCKALSGGGAFTYKTLVRVLVGRCTGLQRMGATHSFARLRRPIPVEVWQGALMRTNTFSTQERCGFLWALYPSVISCAACASVCAPELMVSRFFHQQ